jgi:hypothetical protein
MVFGTLLQFVQHPDVFFLLGIALWLAIPFVLFMENIYFELIQQNNPSLTSFFAILCYHLVISVTDRYL